MKQTTAPANMNPKGYRQIAAPNNTTLTVPVGSSVALLQAVTQDIRWCDDGSIPTTTFGMVLVAGANPYPYVGDLAALRFTEAVTGAQLNVSFYSVTN